MKCQILFSGKHKKNVNLSSAELAQSSDYCFVKMKIIRGSYRRKGPGTSKNSPIGD